MAVYLGSEMVSSGGGIGGGSTGGGSTGGDTFVIKFSSGISDKTYAELRDAIDKKMQIYPILVDGYGNYHPLIITDIGNKSGDEYVKFLLFNTANLGIGELAIITLTFGNDGSKDVIVDNGGIIKITTD